MCAIIKLTYTIKRYIIDIKASLLVTGPRAGTVDVELDKLQINKRQNTIAETLLGNGASLVGFADVSRVPGACGSPVAISVALELDKNIVNNLVISESDFHGHLRERKTDLLALLKESQGQLQSWGYHCRQEQISFLIESDDHLNNLDAFPHKTAATLAGLGWIGKNCLLVTPRFGPRVLLGTILTEAKFRTTEPLTAAACGDCRLCVDACPYGALKNRSWYQGLLRNEILDAHLCNNKRLEFVSSMGRKHSCGLCLQACPIGQ